MIDEDARKQIQKQLGEAVVKQAADGSQVMQITNADGTTTEVENPFVPLVSTYQALAADPQTDPDLSDESRAQILEEIKTGQVIVPSAPEPVITPEKHAGARPPVSPFPNRHDRRRMAVLARRKRGK